MDPNGCIRYPGPRFPPNPFPGGPRFPPNPFPGPIPPYPYPGPRNPRWEI